MKNRTLIGIICMVVAVFMIFFASAIVSNITTSTISVPRLCTDIAKGEKITEKDIETVVVKKDTLPKETITEKSGIVGKFASSNLYSGDYITNRKIGYKTNNSEDVIYSLNGEKFAMSFTIDSFAAGLSGKLKNGDIISLVVKDASGKSVMPPTFKYVKVITTTTAGGVDQDKVVKNENGSQDPPATVTLLVNEIQAQQLAEYEQGTISCVLVYRGTDENCKKFLDAQDNYFRSGSISHTETGG